MDYSFQTQAAILSPELPESSCSYLLQELQLIWNEVGQGPEERERVLQELERECLEAYKRKVNSANVARVRLHRALADSETEFTNLLISLGDRPFPKRTEKLAGTLKEQLDTITLALRDMQLKKEDRVRRFTEVQTEIEKIMSEIMGYLKEYQNVVVNESDLSLKKLEEYHSEHQRLVQEKSNRLLRVEKHLREVRDLAQAMGMDSIEIINGVHSSLNSPSDTGSKQISDVILERLDYTVNQLKNEKQTRMDKLDRLGKALVNLWNLMDVPIEDRQQFIKIATISPSASEGDNCPGASSSIPSSTMLPDTQSHVDFSNMVRCPRRKSKEQEKRGVEVEGKPREVRWTSSMAMELSPSPSSRTI